MSCLYCISKQSMKFGLELDGLLDVYKRQRVIGTEYIPATGKMILCSNHRSVMDPILLGTSVKKRPIRYMAKEELFVKHGKAVNHFLRALGAFPVKRGRGDTKAIEQAIEILEQGGLLGLSLIHIDS